MGASLPKSAEPKSQKAMTSAFGPGASPHAPSTMLPLRFMVTGVLAFFGATLAFVLRPDVLSTYHYNQYVIAVTHLFVLGWISTIVMGAMYQLVPVALETKLYSERLARWHFVLHLIGFAGMVWMFWTWNMKQVGHFGVALATGVGLFVYNIARTLRRVPRWNVIATAVASALVWLSLAVLAGLTIAAGKCSYESAATVGAVDPLVHGLAGVARWVGHFDQMGAMHAHAHLGTVGVFVMLIIGISYKLVPMFTLSELQRPWRAQWSLALLNLGLLGSFFSILLRSAWKPLFTVVGVAGIVLYLVELRAMVQARKRRTLDWGVKSFITAVSLFLPLSLLALVLSWPGLPLNQQTGQLENLYGFLGLAGVVSLAIVGMLYKIIPFLVWYRVYSGKIGLGKIPSLADLYCSRLQAIGYWSYLGGLLAVSVAIVSGNGAGVRWGSTGLLLSLAALLLNVIKMLSHLIWPRFEPFSSKAPTEKLSVPAPASSGASEAFRAGLKTLPSNL